MNCLRPLITHSSPLSTARVCIAASGTLYGSQRSEAPRGSVRQCASRNCGSATMRGNQRSCRCRGARFRSSTETFQICTSLSESPESPRAISSAIIAKVCTSEAGSSSVPPNSAGTPRVRMPILSAPSRISGGSRSSGVMIHSRCQLRRMNGMTTSSTKARQLCRISRCSSESPLSCIGLPPDKIPLNVNTQLRFTACVRPASYPPRIPIASNGNHGQSLNFGVRSGTKDLPMAILAKHLAAAFMTSVGAISADHGFARELTPADVNAADFSTAHQRTSRAVLIKAQVLLDRAGFSSGVIDGRASGNFANALRAFQEQNGLETTGEPDEPTWSKLGATSAEPALINYVITSDEASGPLSQIPHSMH